MSAVIRIANRDLEVVRAREVWHRAWRSRTRVSAPTRWRTCRPARGTSWWPRTPPPGSRVPVAVWWVRRS